jgi:5'-3' exonuclease
MGDAGDNIFGISGWGDKTALEAIQEHGSWENVYKTYHATYGDLRKLFPDLSNPDELRKLQDITTKSGKPKYAEILLGMPYSGVALAVEEKRTKNISKSILMALMFEERVKLAYSLKKMDDEIRDLPDIKKGQYNAKKLLEYFDYYGIASLVDSISVFQ